jgi:hypothetical protein
VLAPASVVVNAPEKTNVPDGAVTVRAEPLFE